MQHYVDKQTSSIQQQLQDLLNSSLDAHRTDSNDIAKRMGTNIQNALGELQKNHDRDLDYARREQEQRNLDF